MFKVVSIFFSKFCVLGKLDQVLCLSVISTVIGSNIFFSSSK